MYTSKAANALNMIHFITNLVLSYEKEQSEYIQSKIDEIQNAVRNQKSAKACKIVNEVSGRKNSCRSKTKATNNEERV